MAELFAPVKSITVQLELGLAHTEVKRKRPGIDPRTGQSIMIEEPTGQLISVGDPSVQGFWRSPMQGVEIMILRLSRSIRP